MRPTRRGERGFTLVETMIAAVILAIGLVGVTAALLAAWQNSREGQLSQYKMALIDANVERALLQNKLALFGTAGTSAYSPLFQAALPAANPTPDQKAIGAAPWVIDPSTPDVNDVCPTISNCVTSQLGTGAIFAVLPDGAIQQCTATTPCKGYTATPAPANCAAAGIPVGLYCREVAVTSGVANTQPYVTVSGANYPQTQAGVPLGAIAYTLWVRVSRVGTTAALATLDREVFVQ
jgi:prepilin-type N-terminal cleavage/methylation domain-containing protein